MAGEKILVVDDEKEISDLIRLYLVREGYRVRLPTVAGKPWNCHLFTNLN